MPNPKFALALFIVTLIFLVTAIIITANPFTILSLSLTAIVFFIAVRTPKPPKN